MSTPNMSPLNMDAKAKYQQKLRSMRSRRTGVDFKERKEFLKKQEEMAKASGKKTDSKKEFEKSMLAGIREVLEKLGVKDATFEQQIRRQIVEGRLKTPNEISGYILRNMNRFKEKKTETPPQEIPPSSTPPEVSSTPQENLSHFPRMKRPTHVLPQ
jgi:hypothetical protein